MTLSVVGSHDARASTDDSGARTICVSAAYYDLAASAAARARLPTNGAGGWLDRGINAELDRLEAPVLACPTCRAMTPHPIVSESVAAMFTERRLACAKCGTARRHSVSHLAPDPEDDAPVVA